LPALPHLPLLLVLLPPVLPLLLHLLLPLHLPEKKRRERNKLFDIKKKTRVSRCGFFILIHRYLNIDY
jgi:hypothetical protein